VKRKKDLFLLISLNFTFICFSIFLKSENKSNYSPLRVSESSIDKDALVLLMRCDNGEMLYIGKGRKETSVLFIFSSDCVPCNNDIVYWKKIASLFSSHAQTLGVVLSDLRSAYNSTKNLKMNFPITIPIDISKFKKSISKIDENQPSTVIIAGNRIVYSKNGNLSTYDYFEIKKKLEVHNEKE